MTYREQIVQAEVTEPISFLETDVVGDAARALRLRRAGMSDLSWEKRLVADSSLEVEPPEGYVFREDLTKEALLVPREGQAHAREGSSPPPPVFVRDACATPEFVFAGGLRWRVGAMLGEGAWGSVYRVEHEGARQRRRVVKIMAATPHQEAGLRMMWNEVGAAMATGDFVASEALHDEQGNVWTAIILERHDGMNGERMITDRRESREPPLYKTPEGAYALAMWLRSVVGTLRMMHAQGWTHRDIKPQNIMVSLEPGEEPLARPIDYGNAARLGAVRTQEFGVVSGSPAFLPPECWIEKDMDLRLCDYWGAVESIALMSGMVSRIPAHTNQQLFYHLQTGTYFDAPMLTAPGDAREFFSQNEISGAHRDLLVWLYEFLEPHQAMPRRQAAWRERGVTKTLTREVAGSDGKMATVTGDFIDDDKFVRELEGHIRALATQAGVPSPESALALLQEFPN